MNYLPKIDQKTKIKPQSDFKQFLQIDSIQKIDVFDKIRRNRQNKRSTSFDTFFILDKNVILQCRWRSTVKISWWHRCGWLWKHKQFGNIAFSSLVFQKYRKSLSPKTSRMQLYNTVIIYTRDPVNYKLWILFARKIPLKEQNVHIPFGRIRK